MTTLTDWALQWGVPFAALYDLQLRMGLDTDPHAAPVTPGSEAAASVQCRLAASREGARLWRNNVGAGYMQDESFVRYGLANESKQMNEKVKSADFVGIRPVVITQALVGQTIGRFVSREMKAPGWRYTGAGREPAQLAWAQLVLSLGGDAAFSTGEF